MPAKPRLWINRGTNVNLIYDIDYQLNKDVLDFFWMYFR